MQLFSVMYNALVQYYTSQNAGFIKIDNNVRAKYPSR